MLRDIERLSAALVYVLCYATANIGLQSLSSVFRYATSNICLQLALVCVRCGATRQRAPACSPGLCVVIWDGDCLPACPRHAAHPYVLTLCDNAPLLLLLISVIHVPPPGVENALEAL